MNEERAKLTQAYRNLEDDARKEVMKQERLANKWYKAWRELEGDDDD